MKKIKIIYWSVTAIMSILILLGAVIDVVKTPEAVAFIKHLGYPEYFIRFIGILKIAGILAILIPVGRRIKEWAYAGLVFDIFGAIYSHISSGDSMQVWLPAFLTLILVVASYVLNLFNSKEIIKQNHD